MELKENYRLVPGGIFYKIGYYLIKTLAILIFPLWNRLIFGYRFTGKENRRIAKQGAVTICNHVHYLDCTMVGCTLGYTMQYFVSLQANLEVPFVRFLVRILGGVPVPRIKRRIPEFSREMVRCLKEGKTVHIYPEGSLQLYYDGIRGFHNGAFSYAFDAGVPVVPFVITFHKPRGLLRVWKRKPCMHLAALDPVYPNPNASRRVEIRRMKDLCRQRMDDWYRLHNETGCM